MNKEKLTELVYINLGRASMCWSDIPSGVFDSTKAAELGKEIMEAIEKYLEEDKEPGWSDPMIEHLQKEEKESEWQKRKRLEVMKESKKRTELDMRKLPDAQKIVANNDIVGHDNEGNPMYRYEGIYYTIDKTFKEILEERIEIPSHWWWDGLEPK
jgi:hypothetical protein